MVNIDIDEDDHSIDGDIPINFDQNDIEFEREDSEYVYPESPELNFADDEEDEDEIQFSTNISSILKQNHEILIETEIVKDSICLTNNTEGQRNEDLQAVSRIRQQNKRRHSKDESLGTVKFKKPRSESNNKSTSPLADININENNIDQIEFSPINDCPEDDGSHKSMFDAYNKLFSSKNYPRICPYNDLKDIDENVSIKPKSGLALLFPIDAFFERKKIKRKPLSWDFDKLEILQNPNPESPINDILLSDNKDEEDILNPLTDCELTKQAKPLPISDELMPKTEWEKNYWKEICPRIGFSFIIQPGMGRIENEKWLRLKEIDSQNGIEWTEFDTGFDIVKNNNNL